MEQKDARPVEDVMPLNWLSSNIRLVNNSEVYVEKPREFTIMSKLELNARLSEKCGTSGRQWEQVFTPLIRGKSLSVIGLGGMGQAAWPHARHESSDVRPQEPLPLSSEFWSCPT